MSAPATSVWLVAAYALVLVAVAWGFDLMARKTSVRAARWRTGQFVYHADHDAWVCPEDHWLWPTSFDPEHRVMRYRAKPSVCNSCPVKSTTIIERRPRGQPRGRSVAVLGRALCRAHRVRRRRIGPSDAAEHADRQTFRGRRAGARCHRGDRRRGGSPVGASSLDHPGECAGSSAAPVNREEAMAADRPVFHQVGWRMGREEEGNEQ